MCHFLVESMPNFGRQECSTKIPRLYDSVLRCKIVLGAQGSELENGLLVGVRKWLIVMPV